MPVLAMGISFQKRRPGGEHDAKGAARRAANQVNRFHGTAWMAIPGRFSARLTISRRLFPGTVVSFLKRDPHGQGLSIFQKAKVIFKNNKMVLSFFVLS